MEDNSFSIIKKPRTNINSGFVGSDDPKQDELLKARVTAHTRKTKLGKISQVTEYNDSRVKKHQALRDKKKEEDKKYIMVLLKKK